MTDVADLSPGTVLVAGTTGWRYVVRGFVGDDESAVIVRGPKGTLLPIETEEIQRGIARGKIEVRG